MKLTGLAIDPPLALLQRMIKTCDQFERDFRCGRRESIEHYLEDFAGAERASLKYRLIGLEVDLRQ